MSPQPSVETTPIIQPSEHRLAELKRALQRQLKRKPKVYEKAALDRAALMTLRAETAALDPKATSEDVVRLDNAARRARQDFERIACIALPKAKAKQQRTMADIEREIAAHAR